MRKTDKDLYKFFYKQIAKIINGELPRGWIDISNFAHPNLIKIEACGSDDSGDR